MFSQSTFPLTFFGRTPRGSTGTDSLGSSVDPANQRWLIISTQATRPQVTGQSATVVAAVTATNSPDVLTLLQGQDESCAEVQVTLPIGCQSLLFL